MQEACLDHVALAWLPFFVERIEHDMLSRYTKFVACWFVCICREWYNVFFGVLVVVVEGVLLLLDIGIGTEDGIIFNITL